MFTTPLVVPWVNPEALAEIPRGVVAIPDAGATLVASLVGPMRRAGLGGTVEATVLVPASREGKAGIDELSRRALEPHWAQQRPADQQEFTSLLRQLIERNYRDNLDGTLGWTMAPGTGRLMADLLSGRKTDIPLDGLTMARYRKAFSGHRSVAAA